MGARVDAGQLFSERRCSARGAVTDFEAESLNGELMGLGSG